MNLRPKIALYEPDIPQNTAAIIRTCSCLGATIDHSNLVLAVDIEEYTSSTEVVYNYETTINNLVENIDQNLKKGGYFIGTCLDGNKVFEALKNSKSLWSEENEHNIRGNTVL